jgi:uncharacterized RmlC-like cupin family protein
MACALFRETSWIPTSLQRRGWTFIPPYVPHQEINASPDQVLEFVLVRSDGQAIAINLDIEPAEKPETVLWVDPVHPDTAPEK